MTRNPFYEAFNKAKKVDVVKLADDPFYGQGHKVKFSVAGKMMYGTVNNCAGEGDCLVLGNDGKWYAGKDTLFALVR